jgi:subtilisin-like proprotein convertase family protein
MSEPISNPKNGVGITQITTEKTYVSTFRGRGGNIPDGREMFIDDILVQEDFRVTKLTVILYNFVHTWVGDLTVQLHHLETGTAVELFRRPGYPQFSSSGLSHDLNGDYSFNDYSSYNFEEAAFRHAVIPSGNYTAIGFLSAFYGQKATGTWRLTIEDCFPGDEGSLGSWQLDLEWEEGNRC